MLLHILGFPAIYSSDIPTLFLFLLGLAAVPKQINLSALARKLRLDLSACLM